MLVPALFSLSLLVVAGAWIVSHLKSWRAARGRQDLSEAERLFLGRRFRRRMQASSMLALLALAVFAGQMIPYRRYPSLFVWFWFGVLLLVIWVFLLALADALANRQHLRELQRDRLVAEAQLRAELSRLQTQQREFREQHNGHAHNGHSRNGPGN